MIEKFSVICADPPYRFSDKLQHSSVARGAQANYDTMSINDIKKLPINNISADDAILALWVPSSLLQEGLDIMGAWGFKHKQTYIWVKTKKKESLTKDIKKGFMELVKKVHRKAIKLDGKPITFKDFEFVLDNTMLAFGMGRLFRQTHEICLIGTRGKVYKHLFSKSQRSVCFAENLKHSSKPEALQDSLDLMFPNPDHKKIELFARRQRPGWLCFGNQAPATSGQDISISLEDLINN